MPQRALRAARGYGAVWIVRGFMTGEHTSITGAVVGDGRGAVLGHDVDIEVHQPLPTDVRVVASQAVRRVTGRTAEAGVDMALVLGETGIRHDIAQAVAFTAHGVRPVHAQVRISKQIHDELAGRHRLVEFVSAFQNVGPLGSMRPVWPRAAELAIVVRVVTIGAENLRSHRTSLRYAIEIQHVWQQTWLRQRAVAGVRDWMT